jgi:hypothetical protein
MDAFANNDRPGTGERAPSFHRGGEKTGVLGENGADGRHRYRNSTGTVAENPETGNNKARIPPAQI